jgi:hypothetical protein
MKKEFNYKYEIVSSKCIAERKLTSSAIVSESRNDGALHMGLDFEPVSRDAKDFNKSLSKILWEASGGVGSPRSDFKQGVGAVMADLMEAAAWGADGWGYRPFSAGKFTGEKIGYHIFRRIIRAMESLGLVETIIGGRREIASGVWAGKTTRFRATSDLLKLAADSGVTTCIAREHYDVVGGPNEPAQVLILKSETTKVRQHRIGGAPIPVDLTHPLAAVHAKQMVELNIFFLKQKIELLPLPLYKLKAPNYRPMTTFKGFHRIFNGGAKVGYGYDKGGRMYPIGGCYQSIERERRPYVRINSEPTTELDIGSSQARILFKLMGHPIGSEVDPYDVPGFPREVVKLWFAQTMGHHRFHRAWTPENRIEYVEKIKSGCNLSKDHRIRDVEAAILKRWPHMADWPSCPYRWGDLQYIEAQAIIEAVYILAIQHGVPAYPVHDSLIVPASKKELAKDVLSAAFKRWVGVEPLIKEK